MGLAERRDNLLPVLHTLATHKNVKAASFFPDTGSLISKLISPDDGDEAEEEDSKTLQNVGSTSEDSADLTDTSLSGVKLEASDPESQAVLDEHEDVIDKLLAVSA